MPDQNENSLIQYYLNLSIFATEFSSIFLIIDHCLLKRGAFMKLAVNYSDNLMTLLDQDPGLPVDYIKVPTIPFPDCWLQFEQGKTRRKLLPHLSQPGVIALGRTDPGEQFNPGMIQQILHQTNPPHLSTHLEARVDYFQEYQEYQHHNHPHIREILREHFLKAIARVKETIAIPLVVENFPYYTWWRHFKTGSEPEFLTEICKAGDCGFLLDIAHARCTAWYFKIDVKEYLDALPLNRLCEIHLAGTQIRQPEGFRDTHTLIDETDYELLQYVLQKSSPHIITIEYGGMPERIMGINGEFEPISRNDITELITTITRVAAMIKG
jgi:uncharacterized protein (UPF0276 family)